MVLSLFATRYLARNGNMRNVWSLKTIDRQLDNFVITYGTTSCHYDTLWSDQWQLSCQIDDLLFSVSRYGVGLCTWRCSYLTSPSTHDGVIKWKHFPRYWPFVRGIHRSPVSSPHKGQWRGAFMFSLKEWLSKQSWGWCSLWRHNNACIMWLRSGWHVWSPKYPIKRVHIYVLVITIYRI